MIMNRKVLVTAATLAVAVIAVGGVRRRAAASNAPSAAQAGGSEAVGRQLSWPIKMQMRLGGADGAVGTDTTVLTGEWLTTVSGSSASGYDLACELDHPHIVGTQVAGPAEVAQLERRLGRRFWISYQADGAAKRMHFPREMADDVRNLLQLLATTTQLVRPAQPSPQWTSTERDGAGTYFAAYERLGPREILKRKMRYVALDGASGGAGSLRISIDSSELHFTLGPQGEPELVHAHEASHLDAKLGGPGLAVDIELDMQHPRSTQVPELVGSLEREEPQLVSEPIITQRPSDEELRARNDARLIKNVSLKTVLEAVHDGRNDSETRSRLEALLRQRPADIAAAVAFAREATAPNAAQSVLEALGSAGTEQAQAALCGLSSDGSAPARLRNQAMTALVLTKEPSEATLATFLQLMAAVREASSERQILFTAGTVAHNGEQAHPELAARIVAALADRYAQCSGESCLVVLNALGNVGTMRALPVLEPALRDAAAERRAAAVDALRLIRDPAADRLINERIRDDPDAKVRVAAIGTARYRPVGPLAESLSRAIESDPVDSVRIQAINVLTEQIDRAPLIQEAFVAAAQSDPTPSVRRLAREALGPRMPPSATH